MVGQTPPLACGYLLRTFGHVDRFIDLDKMIGNGVPEHFEGGFASVIAYYYPHQKAVEDNRSPKRWREYG